MNFNASLQQKLHYGQVACLVGRSVEVNEISEIVKHHKIEEVGGSEGTMPKEDFGEVSREL